MQEIINLSHKLSEKDYPVQMALSQLIFDAYNHNISVTKEEKTEWESIPNEARIDVLSKCAAMFITEIERIKSLNKGGDTLDAILEKDMGKDVLDKIKSQSPDAYILMCSAIKKVVSIKCSEQRRNVLNQITSTPFFVKYRAEFPRSLITQAPEPTL